jgi:protein O-mannosyl-transferase
MSKNHLSASFYYALFIVVITFISFFPALKGGFMQTWDDEKYVTGNPMVKELTAGTVKQMFTKQVNGSYVPLPLLTFAIEYKLFGESPMPFHMTNLLLHILCTLLVFKILRLLKLDLVYAAFGALLFAVHPMKVESVAWITERKDVLFSAFYLGAVITYIQYITESPQKPRFLAYSILLFLGSLFSKIEAVTLPVTLLLIDYLLQRPFRVKLLTEKIPYFILSLFFGLLGLYIIYRIGLHIPDYLKTEKALGFTDRLFFGLYAITGYIIKFFVPYSQSAMYPYPVMTGMTMAWIRYINPLVIVALIFLVVYSARKTLVAAFGMLFFLVNIFFLLQIVSVGSGFFADRYTYIPYIGLIYIVLWFAQETVHKAAGRKFLVLGILSVFAAVFIVMTFTRCKVWKDGVSLWSDVISRYPGTSMESYVNRGISYTVTQEWDKAMDDYTTALSIGPVSAGVYADRGIVYGFTNQPEKAVADFSRAVELDPKNAKALFNRGVTYGNMGQTDSAIIDFRKVLTLDQVNVSAYSALCILLFEEKRFDTCMILAEKGVKLDPYRSELYAIIGNCELETGAPEKAFEPFRHCLRLDDGNLDAFLGLAAAFMLSNDYENATRNLELARQCAQQKNISLDGLADMERSGITLHDRKKEALQNLLSHKR